MTKEKALEYYLSKCSNARRLLARLMKWDEKKPLYMNMASIGVRDLQQARVFASHYGLKWARDSRHPFNHLTNGIGKGYTNKALLIANGFIDLKDKGWTYQDIGTMFKVTRQRVEQRIKYGRRLMAQGVKLKGRAK